MFAEKDGDVRFRRLPFRHTEDEEDQLVVEALRCLKPATDVGFPEHAVIDLARVFWDAMRRVAESHLSHVHVRRAPADRGLAGRDLDDAVWRANVAVGLGDTAVVTVSTSVVW